MKKVFTLLLIAVIALSSAACLSAGKPESSVPKIAQVSCGVDFTAPEGFTVSQDSDSIWLSPTYPDDSSNINVITTTADPSFSLLTREVMSASIESLYLEQYGIETECEIPVFERLTIDGYDAIKCEYRYALYGVQFCQLQYMINADEGYSITFTNVGDADWMDAFAASGATVKVLTENA